MKKSIYPFLLLTLLLLVSCKSKKRMVATLPRLVLNTDSIVADTSNVIAGLFAPDHSQLKDLNVSKGRKRRAKKNKSSADAYKSEDWVLRGTKITSSEVDVSSVYSGVDRVVKYDFTHRDVPISLISIVFFGIMRCCKYHSTLTPQLSNGKRNFGSRTQSIEQIYLNTIRRKNIGSDLGKFAAVVPNRDR